MGERREFELSEDTYERMLINRNPVMLVGGVNLSDFDQLSANEKWIKLGEVMGFKGMTARPIPGKNPRFFTAEVIDQNDDHG